MNRSLQMKFVKDATPKSDRQVTASSQNYMQDAKEILETVGKHLTVLTVAYIAADTLRNVIINATPKR